MVQRCSNGAPFVVLEPEPSVRTGILLEVYDGANPETLLDVLPDTWDRQWNDPLKGPGSATFKVSAGNPKLTANPDLLAYGNLVRFKLDQRTRFTMQIEHKTRTVAGEGDDVDRVIEVSGRGALSVLESAVLYPAEGVFGETDRFAFVTNAAHVMWLALDEAQKRGTLQAVTKPDPVFDANNANFTVFIELSERAGTDLLRIAERHAEVAADVYMTPDLRLLYYNERGIDRTIQTNDVGPVVLRLGHNITAYESDEDGAIRNVLLIETPGGWWQRVEGASVSEHRRREAYLSLGNVTASDQVDRSAEAIFRRSAHPAPNTTVTLRDVDGARPYVDFGVGDWVLAPNPETLELERVRVRGLTVQDGPNDDPEFIPELSTITEELEARLERWLAAMSRGTVGGTAGDVAEPNKAPVEVVEAVDSGVAEHVANAPHVDEISDLADVDISGLADGDLLQYDATAGNWRPVTLNPSGIGGGTYAQRVARLGPSSHWPFDETSGSTATDARGLMDGTYNGSPALNQDGIDPEATPCVDFDGVNDYVTLPILTAEGDRPLSFAAYIRPDDVTAARTIFEAGGSTNGLHLHVRAGSLRAVSILSSSTFTVSHPISAGTIYHVLIVCELRGPAIALYVDGVYIGSAGDARASEQVGGTDSSAIGAGSGGTAGTRNDDGSTTAGFFDGKISQPAVWARALADWEAAYLVNLPSL